MVNPAHRSILLDHQMIVDGVLMRERKDLTKTLNDETGVEESHLTHTRVIGEKSYSDGQKEEEMIETDPLVTKMRCSWFFPWLRRKYRIKSKVQNDNDKWGNIDSDTKIYTIYNVYKPQWELWDGMPSWDEDTRW